MSADSGFFRSGGSSRQEYVLSPFKSLIGDTMLKTKSWRAGRFFYPVIAMGSLE